MCVAAPADAAPWPLASGAPGAPPYAGAMLDTAPAPQMQRSRGAASVRLRDGRLRDLAQSGAAKAFLPRCHSAVPEVVFLNTSGGVTAGDTLAWRLALEGPTAAVGTTQTAERGYAARGVPGRVTVDLSLDAGAALCWLPQETILYDHARLARHTRVDMAADARLVWSEMLVLGRAAMGERLASVHLHDRREVRRGGRLALLEPVRLTGAALDPAEGPVRAALSGGARAHAMVVLMAPGAEDALGALRAVLPAPGAVAGLEVAASAWDGRAVVRVLAADALEMKRTVAAVLEVMRRGAPLPRVWQL